MSQSRTRLLATFLFAVSAALLASPALTAQAAGSLPDGAWTQLTALPEALDSPVFALAVNPADSSMVLAGTPSGTIYRSTDYGTSWTAVKKDLGRGIEALAFSPLKPGLLLAGVRGGGAWRSTDAGATWTQVSGLPPGTTVRSFGFSKSAILAGSDRGVFASADGAAWVQAGLQPLSVAALAVAAVNDPSRVLAGADASQGGEALPVYQTTDGGSTWKLVTGPSGTSNLVAALAAGPLPANATVRPLLMGTNGGLFSSGDNGAHWDQVTGSGALPAADFSAVAWSSKPERYYTASDGGGSGAGGLWVTGDSGQHFASLNPPLPSVTGLAVSSDDKPVLYVATFRPADKTVMLWALRDTGTVPAPPSAALPDAKAVAPAEQQDQPVAAPLGSDWLYALVLGPEGPYLALGLGAVLVLMLALLAHARRGRGRF